MSIDGALAPGFDRLAALLPKLIGLFALPPARQAQTA
jgi:hypothetical protein